MLRVEYERRVPERGERQGLAPLSLESVRESDNQRLFVQLFGQDFVILDCRASDRTVYFSANECFL